MVSSGFEVTVEISQTAENLRFLLWRYQADRKDWAALLAIWSKSDVNRAEELLRGVELRPDELEEITRATGVSVEALVGTSLIAESEVNVVQENIRFLTDHLSYGEKKRLSAAMDIHPSTLSKWRSGELCPRKSRLNALCRHFGLPLATNLETDPIFLSNRLASEREREERAWAQMRIMALDAKTWRTLFPALQLLLAAYEDDIMIEHI
jgi:transcriptional regulator with XRE-family HTH domain